MKTKISLALVLSLMTFTACGKKNCSFSFTQDYNRIERNRVAYNSAMRLDNSRSMSNRRNLQDLQNSCRDLKNNHSSESCTAVVEGKYKEISTHDAKSVCDKADTEMRNWNSQSW